MELVGIERVKVERKVMMMIRGGVERAGARNVALRRGGHARDGVGRGTARPVVHEARVDGQVLEPVTG